MRSRGWEDVGAGSQLTKDRTFRRILGLDVDEAFAHVAWAVRRLFDAPPPDAPPSDAPSPDA